MSGHTRYYVPPDVLAAAMKEARRRARYKRERPPMELGKRCTKCGRGIDGRALDCLPCRLWPTTGETR